MAITIVDDVVGTVAAAAAEAGYALPEGLAENDVVVIALATDDALAEGTEGVTDETWTKYNDTGLGAVPGAQIYYKRMGASPDTEVLLTGEAATIITYAMQAFRGVNVTTVEDAALVTPNTGTSANPDPPAITPVTAGALIIAFALLDDDDTTATAPTGYTNLVENNTGQASAVVGATVAFASRLWSGSGEENPGTFTMASSDGWRAETMVLRPAPSGGGPGGGKGKGPGGGGGNDPGSPGKKGNPPGNRAGNIVANSWRWRL